MDSDIKTWLYDILNAEMEIESFFADRPKEFASFQADFLVRKVPSPNLILS